MRRAPTGPFLARDTALGLPLWGNGVNLTMHPPTKPPRSHKGKKIQNKEYKGKKFSAPLAPGIYRDMGQMRPTSDLLLPRGGGGGGAAEGATQLFQKGTSAPVRVGSTLT